ncbi:hypothetical protein PV325_004500 [Microctonus aethiopoides]|nr:hypothetical protein PV325_004500 [Microctonus aethiopoides]
MTTNVGIIQFRISPIVTPGATGLKNLKINVPSMVRSGDAVSLSCLYDLEGLLYTIKWYINEKEFYRYVPKADPRQNSYPEYGMKIDMGNRYTT